MSLDNPLVDGGSLLWILPLLVSIALPIIMKALGGFSKTSEGTLTGTIKLENVRSDVTGIKVDIDKRFDKMEELINNRENDNRKSDKDIWEKIEIMNTTLKIHDYILNEIKKNGGAKSAI